MQQCVNAQCRLYRWIGQMLSKPTEAASWIDFCQNLLRNSMQVHSSASATLLRSFEQFQVPDTTLVHIQSLGWQMSMRLNIPPKCSLSNNEHLHYQLVLITSFIFCLPGRQSVRVRDLDRSIWHAHWPIVQNFTHCEWWGDQWRPFRWMATIC